SPAVLVQLGLAEGPWASRHLSLYERVDADCDQDGQRRGRDGDERVADRDGAVVAAIEPGDRDRNRARCDERGEQGRGDDAGQIASREIAREREQDHGVTTTGASASPATGTSTSSRTLSAVTWVRWAMRKMTAIITAVMMDTAMTPVVALENAATSSSADAPIRPAA